MNFGPAARKASKEPEASFNMKAGRLESSMITCFLTIIVRPTNVEKFKPKGLGCAGLIKIS
jgi:hypothetical protein